jgi:hypothetical protein
VKRTLRNFNSLSTKALKSIPKVPVGRLDEIARLGALHFQRGLLSTNYSPVPFPIAFRLTAVAP